jgi:hypothetical protein
MNGANSERRDLAALPALIDASLQEVKRHASGMVHAASTASQGKLASDSLKKLHDRLDAAMSELVRMLSEVQHA